MPKPTVEVDFLGKEVTIDNDGTIEFEDKLTAEIIAKMRGEYLRKLALEKMDKILKKAGRQIFNMPNPDALLLKKFFFDGWFVGEWFIDSRELHTVPQISGRL